MNKIDTKFNLSVIEKEVVVLNAVFDLINTIVNYEVLEISEEKCEEVGFKSSTHSKFFNIMLVDFISEPDKKVFGLEGSYLDCLNNIVVMPLLGSNKEVVGLKASIESLSSWLESKLVYKKAWFPSLDLELNFEIKRVELIKICGNISKHNYTRLTGVASILREIFKHNGHKISLYQSLSILDEFQEQFQQNVLSYHASTIGAFLNNIRWGIYEYLLPIYHKSCVFLSSCERGFKSYKYIYPTEVNNNFAQECFCNLMNKIKNKPYVSKFSAPDYLKKRY